jgi:hypothetical protein
LSLWIRDPRFRFSFLSCTSDKLDANTEEAQIMTEYNAAQKRITYTLDGDPQVVGRGTDGKNWQAPADRVTPDTPGALMTADGDCYAPRRGYEPPGANRTQSLEYTLDGDPYLVTREGSKIVSRSRAERASGSEMDGPYAVRTADGDVYVKSRESSGYGWM